MDSVDRQHKIKCTDLLLLTPLCLTQMGRMLGMSGPDGEDLPEQLLGKVEGMLEVVRKVGRR